MSNYRIQEAVLAQNLRSLHHALTLIVAQRALILTKVKLSAILAPSPQTGQTVSYTLLDRYTVDFVLCDRHTTKPLLVIQQEEATGDYQQQNTNDVIERLVVSSGLPMICITSEMTYRMDRLLRLIEPYLTDDKRGADYANGERLPLADSTDGADAKRPPIPRPATLFSRN